MKQTMAGAMAASTLLLAATPASAEWVRIGEDAGVVSYADTNVVKDGDLRRVTELLDLWQRAPTGEMSRRGLWEYDCRVERARLLSVSFHAEHMGKGKVLTAVSPRGDWSPVPADTIGAALMRYACAK